MKTKLSLWSKLASKVTVNTNDIDDKTGLLNSCYFYQVFDQSFEQAKKRQAPMSLIVADLDLLRDVNNTYGHSAGDSVLDSVGTIIQEHIRERCVAARLSADELVILLPGMGQVAAHSVAEKLRVTIALASFYSTGMLRSFSITASLGVGELSHSHIYNGDLFHAANIALLRA